MFNIRHLPVSILAATAFTLAACSPSTSPTETAAAEVIIPAERFFTADQFTYANYQEVVVKHADLDLDVDFDRKVLDGHVTLNFERLKPGAQTLTLDTKDADGGEGKALPLLPSSSALRSDHVARSRYARRAHDL